MLKETHYLYIILPPMFFYKLVQLQNPGIIDNTLGMMSSFADPAGLAAETPQRVEMLITYSVMGLSISITEILLVLIISTGLDKITSQKETLLEKETIIMKERLELYHRYRKYKRIYHNILHIQKVLTGNNKNDIVNATLIHNGDISNLNASPSTIVVQTPTGSMNINSSSNSVEEYLEQESKIISSKEEMDDVEKKINRNRQISLCINNLRHSYNLGSKKVKYTLDNFSLEIKKGEIIALLSLSGGGKSTAINVIVGLLEKCGGKIYQPFSIKGSTNLNNCALVPQHDVCLPFLTIEDHLKLMCIAHDLDYEGNYIQSLINRLLLREHILKQINQLSGGSRRRLSLLMALIQASEGNNCGIICADEIMVGLDPSLRRDVLNILSQSIHCVEGLSILMTTHYMEDCDIADRIVILKEGRIVLNLPTEQLVKRSELLSEYQKNRSIKKMSSTVGIDPNTFMEDLFMKIIGESNE